MIFNMVPLISPGRAEIPGGLNELFGGSYILLKMFISPHLRLCWNCFRSDHFVCVFPKPNRICYYFKVQHIFKQRQWKDEVIIYSLILHSLCWYSSGGGSCCVEDCRCTEFIKTAKQSNRFLFINWIHFQVTLVMNLFQNKSPFIIYIFCFILPFWESLEWVCVQVGCEHPPGKMHNKTELFTKVSHVTCGWTFFFMWPSLKSPFLARLSVCAFISYLIVL